MGKVSTSAHEDLSSAKVRLSRTSGRLANWKHQDFDKLPQLTYEYADDDKRFASKEDKLFEFGKSFWGRDNNTSRTHQEQYEFDLRQGVLNLIEALDKQYQNAFASELESEFK